MGIALNEYKTNRSHLVRELEEYGRSLDEMELEDEKRKVLQYKEDILRDNFQLVVVGEFSRGKSTFINALLGSQILPSSAKPTTTILNKIVYSSEPEIHLHFHDGKRQPEAISEEAFKKLVAPMDPIPGDAFSEKEYDRQVNYVKEIRYAEIGRNLSICENGVEIIDTPGTNDLDPVREEITNTIIPRSDAAILLLSAIKILSESELSLLRDRLLANDIQKIFVVINFKDELETEEDQRKVMEFAYNNLKEILNQPKIYMVSAKHALNARRKENGEELVTKRGRPIKVWNFDETGFSELESHLADFLQHERGSIKLLKPLRRTLENIKDVKKKHIAFERNVLNSKADNLKEKVAAFRPKVDLAKNNAKESQKDLKRRLQFEEKGLIQWYEKELGKISNVALKTFDDYRHLNPTDISSKIELSVAGLEKEVFEQKKKKMNAIAKQSIQGASVKINEEWTNMEFELNNIVQTKQGYSLLPAVNRNQEVDAVDDFFDSVYGELEEAWNNSQSFWTAAGVGIGFAVSAAVHGIAKIFSWGWSKLTGGDEKSQLRNNLAAHYNETADKKIIVLKAEYRNMSKSAEDQYKAIVEQQLKQVEKQLDQLIKSTQLEGNEIIKRQEQLRMRERKLNAIADNLEQLARKLHYQSSGKAGVS